MLTEEVRRANPYDCDFPVDDPKLFAGRREELALLGDEIKKFASPPHIPPMFAMVGERRVGKSSLLNQVTRICREYKLVGAIVELKDVSVSAPREFWRLLFHELTRSSEAEGCLRSLDHTKNIGFKLNVDKVDSDYVPPSVDILQFDNYYRDDVLSVAPLPSFIVEEDLKKLCDCALAAGLNGMMLLIDEAQLLLQSNEIQQELRSAITKARRCSVIFAGTETLSQLFNDPSRPLYRQARVINLKNFLDKNDVAECALLPLTDAERMLMSPMTVDYLARLSQGKPNQIRLICRSIYSQYERGDQNDLNINIRTLDDVLAIIAASYTQFDLLKLVDKIRKLNTVELEELYYMTRYHDWSIDDVIELCESFRGEGKSDLAEARRRRLLEEKVHKFVVSGLMADQPGKCVLAGDEFLYLYLRFWFEIHKFGELSSRLELGKGAPTPFHEKVDKLAASISTMLSNVPRITVITHLSHDADIEYVAQGIKRRFTALKACLESNKSKAEEISEGNLVEFLEECASICELVKSPGPHHLVWFIAHNLEDPRELTRVEMYYDPFPLALLLSADQRKTLEKQAHYAKVKIERLDDLKVAYLPKLSALLNATGGPTIDEIMEDASMVTRWRMASVRYLVDSSTESSSEKGGEPEGTEQSKRDPWLEMYDKGDPVGAESDLTQRISHAGGTKESSRYYNDRGYIRYGLKKAEEAEKDLETALAYHYEHPAVTLLNLSVVFMDRQAYERAIDIIEDALFLTFSREEIEVGYLRLRVPRVHFGFGMLERYEQRPANCLEVAYVNLAFALLNWDKPGQALEALQEGLSLMPSSFRLKHAMGRLHLHRKNAKLADPIFDELYNMEIKIDDDAIRKEVEDYRAHFLRIKRNPRQNQ